MFSGEYTRSGRDLIISDDLHRIVLSDYFAGEKRAALISPEGATVDHTLVEALTGHQHYAQAQGADPVAKVIGHIVKITGSASVVRNGVAIAANVGDAVYQSDVVETGSNSTIGLVLDDGSAVNLSAATRFMLNELNYDPNSRSNSSLMTLMQGAANLIAGQVAPTGDMKVATPVAVIGVRGTVLLLDIAASDGTVQTAVVEQQDGQVHTVQVYSTTGDLIGTVSSNGPALRLIPAGNFQVVAQQTDKTAAQLGQEATALQQILNTYDTGKLQFPTLPQHAEAPSQNSNPGTTKAAAVGSTPVLPSQPPSTTVFTDPSGTKVAGLTQPASTTPTTTVASPTTSTTSSSDSSSSSQTTTDTDLPTVVTPTIGNPGGTTNLKSLTITGTADPGTVVTILDTYKGGTAQLGTATTSPSGVWTANVTLPGEGVNSVVAKDPSGDVSTPVVFMLDSTPPVVTITSSGGQTAIAKQTISGNVAAAAGEAAVGTTVALFDTVNGVTTQIGTAQADANGNWSTTVTLSGNGTHSIVAEDTDAAGNVGTSPPVTFNLGGLPTVTIAAVDGNNVINAANAAAGVALQGSVTGIAANSTFTVTVTDNRVIKTYTATVDGTGTSWSATIPSGDATGLANGTATITGQVTDSNGNLARFSQNVTIAETLPTVTISAVDGNNVINAANAAAGVALHGSITGVAANSTFTVMVTDNGVVKTYTATVDGAGTSWSATIPSSDATGLANGTAAITAQVTDSNGNPASFSQNVTVAEAGPTVTSLTDTTSNGSNDLDAGKSVTFTLTASEPLTVANGAALTLSNGASAVYNSATGTFVHTVQSGDTNTGDLKVTGYTGSITDATGNALVPSGVALDTHVQIDTVAPTVTSLTDTTTNSSTDLNAGKSVTFTLTASETLTVANGAALTLSNGASAVYNSATGTFVYTVQSGDTNTGDLKVTGYTGSIADAAGNALASSGVALDTHVQIDTVAPTVTSLTNTTTNNSSDLDAGKDVTFTLTASETLTIGNGAALALSNGASAVYNSATGTFVYTVQSGDTGTSDLKVTGYTGTITDAAGNALASSSVALDTHVQIDTVAPTVTSLTDTTTSGSTDLAAGKSVTFTLAASEQLTIAAGAALTLSNGASAVYNSATGTFVYTVQSGDTNTSDLKVTGYSGSITDAAGNALVQGGVTLDTHVQIDTVAPTVTSLTDTTSSGSNDLDAGKSVSFTLTASETLTVANGAALTLSNGASAVYNSSTSTFVYTVQSSDTNTSDLKVTGYTGSITDGAGNVLVASGVTLDTHIQIDTVLPTLTIAAVDGDNVINAANAQQGVALSGTVSGITANSNFNVTVADNGVINTYVATVNGAGTGWSATIPSADAKALANGTATITAEVTDAFGNPASFSQDVTVAESGPAVTINPVDGNNVINAANAAAGISLSGSVAGIAANTPFNVTVVDNGVTKTYTATVDSAGTGWTASIPSADATGFANGTAIVTATVVDTNQNTATVTQNVTVAETAPTVMSLTDTTTNSSNDLDAGKSVTFTLTASETLTVASGAALTLSNGASAVYNSATGTFVYTVQSGDTNTSDLKVNGYTGSIADGAGNALVQGGVTLDTHVQIDTVAPTVASLTDTTSNGSSDLDTGKSVTFTLAASETLTIAAGSALTLSNGASAVYNSATGTFVYTVQSGDTNTSDLKVTGYTGAITDAAGNALVSSGVTLDTHVQIDTTAPTVTSLTDTTTNSSSDLDAGKSVTFTLKASETLTIGSGAALTLSNGASAVYNNSTGAFVYTVQSGDTNTGDLKVTGYTGAITDAAGNALVQTGVTLDTHTQIDTTAPTVTSLTDTTTNSSSDLDAGKSVTFTLVASETLTIAAGAALTLSNGASAVYNSGTGTFVYTVQSGNTNTSDLKVTGYTGSITDAAGNALVQTGVTLDTHTQIDTVAPTVVINTSGATTGDPTQTISGTVTDAESAVGNTVTLYDTYNGVTTEIGTVPVSSGAWSDTDVTLTGNGTHSIVAEDTDAAGNTGSSAPVVFTLTATNEPFQWTNSSGGDFATGSNWNNGFAPGPADDVVIAATGTYTVTTSQDESVHSLQLGAGATLEVGADHTLASSSSTTIASNSQLLLDQGAVLQVSGQVSNAAGIDVNPVVSSTFNESGIVVSSGGEIQVGGSVSFEGQGTILLDAGAAIENAPAGAAVLDNYNFLLWTGSGTIDGQLTLLNETVSSPDLPPDIAVIGAGNTLIIDPASFTNNSFLGAYNGATLQIGDLDANHIFTNLQVDPNNAGGDELNGGVYFVESNTFSNSTINFTGENALPITSLNATVLIEGGNITSGGVDLSQSLTYIGSSGSLQVIATTPGFSDQNSVEVAGNIIISGSSFDSNGLAIDSSASIGGTGYLSTIYNDSPQEIINNGAIGAGSTGTGTLEITASDITGTGLIEIYGGSTLVIDAEQINFSTDKSFASVGAGQTVFLGGTLDIGGTEVNTSTFGATIEFFSGSKAIDLTGIAGGNNYSFNGSQLTILSGNTVLASLNLSGLTASTPFLVTSDGANGTLIEAETGPTVAIALGSTNVTAGNPTTTVTFTFSDAPAAFSLADTTATGGSLSNLQQTSATVWNATFTADSNTQTTTASVNVTGGSYQDSSGNLGPGGSSGNFSVDTNPNSWANPSGGSWTVASNWSSGTVPASSANAQIVPYGATAPYTITIASGATETVNSLTLSDPNVTLLDEGSLSILGTLMATAGVLEISGDGTLSVANSAGFAVDFIGTGGTLVLGSDISGTVNAVATSAPATISGDGNVTTTSGDAIDLSANTTTNLTVNLTGTITGAAGGIFVDPVQTGSISITVSGIVTGNAGTGIIAEQGTGGITVGGAATVTGMGNGNSGILAEIVNTADSSNIFVEPTGSVSGAYDGIRAFTDGTGNVTVTTGENISITGGEFYGISAGSYSTGDVSVTTAAGDSIFSGSDGISAFNDATSIPQANGLTQSTITVTAYGTINSGAAVSTTNFAPGGIVTGYNGTSASPTSLNSAVYGDVFVYNYANIDAAGGDGIRAYNYGNGNITVEDLSFEDLGTATTINAPGRYGIFAVTYGQGNIAISTSAGDTINSGSNGIQAADNGTVIPSTETIDISAAGKINSGSVSGNGGLPAGISAGFNPSGANSVTTTVQGDVLLDSSAIVNAASGIGIGLYNWGTGTIKATLEASSSITAPNAGVQANAEGGGSVTVTNHGTIDATAGVGIFAGSGFTSNGGTSGTPGGLITVTNTGSVTSLGSSSNPVIQISATQINNDTTPGAIFANSGTVTSALFSTSSQNQAVATYQGSLTINNTGTITGNVSLASGTFNNNGGVWNANGVNNFGSGNDVINNTGVINLSGASFLFASSQPLALNNSNTVNVQADAYADIIATVAGYNGQGGTFTIGDSANLEFASSVAANQTISFVDNDGLLTLDSPSTFAGELANLQVGDSIMLPDIGAPINSVAINTEVVGGVTEYFLQVDANNSPLFLDNQVNGVYEGVQLLNYPASTAQFNILSSDEIELVPVGAATITGSSGPLARSGSTQQFYILSDATISGSGGAGFSATSSDATSGDFLTVDIDQNSSILNLSSGVNGVNLTTTAGANIAVVNAGSITSSGGIGINTNSGTGSTIIVDNGSVSGGTGIVANTTGSATLEIIMGLKATVTGTSKFGLAAVSQLGNIYIAMANQDTITSASNGINAIDEGSSIAAGAPDGTILGTILSSILIAADGTINSASTDPSAGNAPAGIKAGYNGGSNAPTTAVNGDVTINNAATINAAAGPGIEAFNDGNGNIAVTEEQGTITATAAGNTNSTTGFAQYGIGAFEYETGNITVTTAFGTTINSGSSGIQAINQANIIAAPAPNSGEQPIQITIVAQGTINSGTNEDNGGFAPAGLEAGYNPITNPGTFDSAVNGNVLINMNGGSITAAAGPGIKAFDYGIGNVTVNVASGSTITANTAGGTGELSAAPYGIGAFNYGPGNIAVTTGTGSIITSGSSGIDAVNQATAIDPNTYDTVITVTAAGTINSGTVPSNSGSAPSGISAGFFGGTGTSATPNQNVTGTVIVNNAANISASANAGINAFNYGNGDITVNDAAGTMVKGGNYGIEASEDSGGTGDIAIDLSANDGVTGTSSYGIFAVSNDTGNISVTTSSGDIITSGSAGIDAVNEATTVGPGSSVVVDASGTIDPGTTPTGTGHASAGIAASYNPGLISPADGSSSVQGSVSITDFATINASSAGVDGIRGENYGTGAITIVAEAGATINAGEYGIAAFGYDGGIVTITNYANVIGGSAAIDATTTGPDAIDNYGQLTGIVIAENAAFTNEAGGLWSLNGHSIFTGSSIFVNDGELQSTATSEISGLLGLNNSGSIEVQSGSLKLDTAVSGTGTLKIDADAMLEVASIVTSGQTVVFGSTTGELKLDQAENFNGVISGFTGMSEANSDEIDLADINHESASFSEQFNSTTDTLTVTDGTHTAVIQFTGTVGTLDFADDGTPINGVSGTSGTLVYDPPSTYESPGPMAMLQTPVLQSMTVVVASPNLTVSGPAINDNFAFNFAAVGQTTITNFHPATDTLEFGKSVFTSAQAVLNATQDDGHGNTVIHIDSADSITLNGVLKAQLHAADFHFL